MYWKVSITTTQLLQPLPELNLVLPSECIGLDNFHVERPIYRPNKPKSAQFGGSYKLYISLGVGEARVFRQIPD